MSAALAIFVAVSSLVVLIGFLLTGRKSAVDSRLETYGAAPTTAARRGEQDDLLGEVPSFPLFAMLVPANQESRRKVGDRLLQAGLYKRNSYAAYMTAKALLMLGPILLGVGAGSAGMVTPQNGLIFGSVVSVFGLIVPSFWLDAQLKQRQSALRRALPDALDVIIVCLEGGLSLPASFAKVASELRSVHPMLASEMAIVQREIQMGHSTGEALKSFAQRFDLEELRSMASVVLQAERFGSSVVKALRVHADSLREKRMQRAEEMAQKASVKILLPTLLCIFPTLFVVLLGPAAFDIYEVMTNMNR